MITNPLEIQRIIDQSFKSPRTVSVLINSRQRFERLASSIESLKDNARRPDEVEIIVRVDDDDTGTITQTKRLAGVTTVIGERVGYCGAHSMYYDGLLRSSGEFLLMWADEFMMDVRHWEDFLDPHRGQVCIVFTQNEHTNAIHRSIPALWEKVGIGHQVDTYYKVIALELGVYVRHDAFRVYSRPHRYGATDPPPRVYTDEMHYGWARRKDEIYEMTDTLKPFMNPLAFAAYRPLTTGIHSQSQPINDPGRGKIYF